MKTATQRSHESTIPSEKTPSRPSLRARLQDLLRRWWLQGDGLARFHSWAGRNVPQPLEPILITIWSFLFFSLARDFRCSISHNLKAIFPADSTFRNLARTYRVFWNFASCETDAVRHRVIGTPTDWEIEGNHHFMRVADAQRNIPAIILTAHMGNYDLSAYVFFQRMTRKVYMVRAPEINPEMQELRERQMAAHYQERNCVINFNQPEGMLALDLTKALQRGDVVAIQGDRVFGNLSTTEGEMFGRRVVLPQGPFALSLASGAEIYPMFTVRVSMRRFRVICLPPFQVERRRGDQAAATREAISQWTRGLSGILRQYWHQWYAIDKLFGEPVPGQPAESDDD